MRWHSLLLPLVVLACSSGVQTRQRPDGTWQVTCKTSFEECARRAEKVCGSLGSRVVAGGARDQLFGSEGNQVKVQRSDVIVACGAEPPKAAATPSAPAPRASSESDRVCAPGSTQRCYGPGACAGGQACLPDGSGYGACDCGAPQAPAAVEDAGT
jgi:hypothetical protein